MSLAGFQHSTAPEFTHQAMSIADQLFEEGYQKGIERGLQEGSIMGCIQVYQGAFGFPMSSVCELASKSSKNSSDCLPNGGLVRQPSA